MAWVFSGLSLVHILSHQYGHFGFECKTFTCGIIGIDEKTGRTLSPNPFGIFMAIVMITGILLILLNVITYFQVSRKTQKLFLQIKDTNLEAGKKILEKEKALGKMVMIITGSFFVVYCPQITLQVANPYAQISDRPAYISTLLLACSLVVIDPIIYCVSHEIYREEIKSMLEICYTKLHALFLSIITKLERCKD